MIIAMGWVMIMPGHTAQARSPSNGAVLNAAILKRVIP